MRAKHCVLLLALRQGGRAEVQAVDLSHAEVNEQLGTSGAYTRAVDGFWRGLGLPAAE